MKIVTIEGKDFRVSDIEAKLIKTLILETQEEFPVDVAYSAPWEPRFGEFSVMMDGEVRQVHPQDGNRKFGIEYQTEEEGREASKAMRTHNRLLNYVTEFDQDWKADWSDIEHKKWYVTYDYNRTEWKRGFVTYNRDITGVYMSEECAIGLVDKLNSGEVIR